LFWIKVKLWNVAPMFNYSKTVKIIVKFMNFNSALRKKLKEAR